MRRPRRELSTPGRAVTQSQAGPRLRSRREQIPSFCEMPEESPIPENPNERENKNAGDYFEGTQFISRSPSTGKVFKVTYDQQTLTRLKTALRNVASEHGFGPLEPESLLRTIHGLGEEGLYIPGPSFRSRNVYPPSYDFCRQFLARDRNFVRSLLEVVFCKQTFAARDVETLSLEENVVSVEFDHRLRKRKIEIHYLTGLNKNDRMCVIIEGCGTEPNFFRFGHSVLWANTRLLAPYRGMRPVRIESGVD